MESDDIEWILTKKVGPVRPSVRLWLHSVFSETGCRWVAAVIDQRFAPKTSESEESVPSRVRVMLPVIVALWTIATNGRIRYIKSYFILSNLRWIWGGPQRLCLSLWKRLIISITIPLTNVIDATKVPRLIRSIEWLRFRKQMNKQTKEKAKENGEKEREIKQDLTLAWSTKPDASFPKFRLTTCAH